MTDRQHDDALDRPLFSIGTVSRETGLPATTLRTWEERYGGVVPHRDESGQRLYTRRQIGELAWIKQQIDAGLKPSEAHRLLAGTHTRPTGDSSAILGDPYVRFYVWTAQSRHQILDVLGRLRSSTGAISAFLKVNVPHPEFGLMSSCVVASTTPERLANPDLARFGGVAWSELPEAREVLERGETYEHRTEELDQRARDLYAPTDIRAELHAPLTIGSVWLAVVGIASDRPRAWTDEERRRTEQARDVLQADHEAHLARVRFGEIMGSGAGQEPPKPAAVEM